MTSTPRATSIHKVRRDVLGGKRGDGDKRSERIRRPDPSVIRVGAPDESLTTVAGLVAFGQYTRQLGLERQLRQLFFDMKDGPLVVYPMEAQLRMLIDANVVGETRVFGLEALAADPLFVRIAGGVVPSIDTVYRDLCRFDDLHLSHLEALMAYYGGACVNQSAESFAYLDIDTTVEPLFGNQEGALPGPNPRYHGRPSYHPILGVMAETQTCIGAELRPGDRGLGEDDAGFVRRTVQVAKAAVGKRMLVARIDAGGDCAEILEAIHQQHAFFIAKARCTRDICNEVTVADNWRTVDIDADGKPSRQVAEISFQRDAWQERGLKFRVIAVRSRERDSGKQLYLWTDLDFTVQIFITNDTVRAAEDIAADYDGRAEVEPLIAELKNGLGIGKVPSADFNANHALFLLKLLTHNLVRSFVLQHAPDVAYFRVEWLRRALFRVPGRLLRSGRQWTLRLPPGSRLQPLLN